MLPFYHSGMGHVLPKGSIVPRYGNDIYVEVGDSVYLRDVLPRCKCKGKEQKVRILLLKNRRALPPKNTGHHISSLLDS